MVKRDLEELAIYQIEGNKESVPLSCLCNLYLEKTSEIIYVTKNKKLYGIVCMGEVLFNHMQNVEARINTLFTSIVGYNVAKAHEIFDSKRKINKIPVIDEQGVLLGDYSRWDDMSFIERNHIWLAQGEAVKNVLKLYEMVYIMKPVETTNPYYLQLMKYFDSYHINYMILGKEKFEEILCEKVICIFLNEDERIGTQCLYGIEPCLYDVFGNDIREYDMIANKRYNARLTTYKNLLLQIIKEVQLTNLKIQDPIEFGKKIFNPNLYCNLLDDKATVLLAALKEKGIKSLCLHSFESERTDYGTDFHNNLTERIEKYKRNVDKRWLKKVESETFYGELYQQEDYRKEVAQNEIYYAENVFEYKKDVIGKYFNAKDGRRITCYQPKEYIGTIYLLGPCTIIGACVEDQYTIESILQKRLLEEGYAYRVENCGSMIRRDSEIDNRLKEIGAFCDRDIVIYQSGIGITAGIENESLEKIFEKYNIPSAWVADGFAHCNHKANEAISVSLLEMLKPHLLDRTEECSYNDVVQIDVHNIMKDYINNKYLFQIPLFLVEKTATIGAIIMKANPFHKGHRYLIEQAKEYVDTLIIFVIDDESFMFPFEERFKMVIEGTKDINNVIVVPSGDFIVSRNNFQEYYTQQFSLTTILNAEYDLNVFVDYIAGPLHLTHRFAGANPKGRIKNVYHDAMRRILSQKGISFIEIPRMMVEGEVVDSQKIHKYLVDGEYEKVFSFVPESTKRYLLEQLDLFVKVAEDSGVNIE